MTILVLRKYQNTFCQLTDWFLIGYSFVVDKEGTSYLSQLELLDYLSSLVLNYLTS
jgi:hypothetical protein